MLAKLRPASTLITPMLFATLGLSLFASIRIVTARLIANSGRVEDLRRASRILPADEQLYLRLATVDPTSERVYLEQAAASNPSDSYPLIHLGILAETRGEIALAESSLLHAASLDVRPVSSWNLANFYFRQGRRADFYKWAQRYWALSSEDSGGLFRLAWELDPDADKLLLAFQPVSCREILGLASFLTGRGLFPQAEPAEFALAGCHDPGAAPEVQAFVSHMIAADQATTALRAWNALAAAAPSAYQALDPGHGSSLTNTNFRLPFTESGFDWHLNRAAGVQAIQSPSNGQLHFELDGSQAQQTTLLFQPVALVAGRTYRFTCRITGDSNGDEAAFHWRLVELATGRTLPSGLDLPAETGTHHPVWRFTAPSSPRSIALALAYIRPEGHATYYGSIDLEEVSLELLPD